jgi:hypothetical protein
MQHVGTSHVADCFDGILSNSILKLCTDTTETELLLQRFAVIFKFG